MNSVAAATLHIHLLGEFHLLINDEPITSLIAERPQTLLAYLLLRRRAPQSRQHLAFLLWPDSSESQARTNLRNLLHTVRQILPDSERYLAVEPLTLQWRPDAPFILDVAQFETAIDEASQSEDTNQVRHYLETAVSLYQGELLPGNYDDWLLAERERLRQAFLDALENLIKLLEQSGDYRGAIHYGQRLLQQDPLNEVTYVQLMRLHALSGDRAGLRRIYQTCTATLERELAVEPGPTTRAAYEQLLRMDAVPPEKVTAAPSLPTIPTWQPRPLPLPTTPFIGRETELAEIAQLLANPDCRLLTIVGLGGMGKTRLALQTAVGHRPIYSDGVAFVPLAPLQMAELLVSVIGDALQFNFFAATDSHTQLFNFLSQKEILLVLDNFEHLLESAETLADLLVAAPRVKLLVTSRQRLNLQGEWVYEIGGLPLPAADDTVPLAENSALALFWQSARRADSRFTLTTTEENHMLRICRLVGGMPLAIELAASWVRLLSCAEIAREIEQGLDFLAASLRNVPERHRSIQAVFDYSWALLTPLEQQVLARLSIFRGGFTREAAERVAKATLPLLSDLVDKSLVRRSKTAQYDLHELIRQYAQEQLINSDEFDDTSEKHFEFFLEMAEKSKSKLRSNEQIVWLKRLEQDYDNLRVALEWSLKERPTTTDLSQFEEYPAQRALRLTAALYLYWKLHTNWGNGRKWLQRALAQAPKSPPTRELAEAINAAALLAVEQADTQRARQLAEEGLALARQLGNSYSIAQALNSLGLVLWKQKDYATARVHCEQALARFRDLGNKINIADSLKDLGRIATNQNDLEAANAYFEECLEIYQDFGSKLEFNWALSDLGLLAYLRNDFAVARSYHEKSLILFREVGSIAGIEMTLNRLGDVARCENDFDEAERCYTECLTAYKQTGDKDEIPSLLHNLGYVAKYRGEYAQAIALFQEGLATHIETGNQGGIAECVAGIAAVLTAQSQVACAARLFGAAEILREKVGTALWPANRLEYESSLAILHASMDEASLDAAWTAGRDLSMEQLHNLVHSELPCGESTLSRRR